jgi:hypothetical protein
MVIVVIELRQQRTFLPLAMAEVLSWNQKGSQQESLSEPRLHIRDSATPSFSALVYTRCLLVHPHLRIRSKCVPYLKLLFEPRLRVGSQVVNVHWCIPVHVTLVVLSRHSILECQEKQTPEPRPFLGPG